MKKELVRFFMRDKKHDITLPFEVAEKVMKSKDQLVLLNDKNGKWTGVTINKAEIISTDHDFEEEVRANVETRTERLLTEKEITPEERIRINKMLDEIGKTFKAK